ncbi:MAG: aminotransferase class I/II-fold pyridoxal phosphate-dependent enzyme [Dyadobacter sp.]|uniref:DegT/DnrJ/EryC1/StrS family aminotransferase n=1 Tax=Dyadobacter sp. TaxID=1914288 RepID=UPI0032656716
MKEKIWLSPPHMSGREMKYIQEAFDGNWIAPVGPNVDAFENELCAYTGSKYAVALSSGTAALHLALIILGIQQGDIVLCQSLTFVASANPIVYLGATPVFIDSEPVTWNICPDALERAIKYYVRIGKKPKAVIIVHLYGMPAMLDEIMYLCKKYDIRLIEDAAEALGSEYNGKKVGTFGDVGILSFNGNKIITTSGGGAFLSAIKGYAEKARFLATQARDPASHYQHSEIGYNYKLSNICAGIGLGQMEVIRERVAQRRENFRLYQQHLGSLPGLAFQPELLGSFSNRWLTVALFESNGQKSSKKIRLVLEENHIESRPLWKPLHMQPAFENTPYFGSNVAERLFLNGLCLPSGSNLPPESIDCVCQKIVNL